MSEIVLLDCTLRDGGYYTAWDFPRPLVEDYLLAVRAAGADIVEMGFRFLENRGYRGPAAFSTDSYLAGFRYPEGLGVGVMVNGADLCGPGGREDALARLFPAPAAESPVGLVRIACHQHELAQAFPAAGWLADRGYRVGINLMQIADRTAAQIDALTAMARDWPLSVLYVADSTGSLTPDATAAIVAQLRAGWTGPLGIHTHDNMGLALANTLRARAAGVSWLDATVTGMGRGPGNARTEELAIEVGALRDRPVGLVALMKLIRDRFAPLKARHGWGTNPWYHLAGRYGIHPTYVQEMLGDARYGDDDIAAVIEHLRHEGGRQFSFNTLDAARRFFVGTPRGSWNPAGTFGRREVLLLGTGPGVAQHRDAIEHYIRRRRPLVMALNTQSAVDQALIDLRIACHPVRLLADAETHLRLPQPLITPAAMLPETLRGALAGKALLDFGLGVEPGRFAFHETYCIAPTSLVLAYALAVATSGGAARVLMAGFDGYAPGDPRNGETDAVLSAFGAQADACRLLAVTPTCHRLASASIHAPEV